MRKQSSESHLSGFLKTILLLPCLTMIVACAKTGSFSVTSSTPSLNLGQSSPAVPPVDAPPANSTPTPLPSSPVDGGQQDLPSTTPAFKPEPLVWESSSHPERADWSRGLQQIIAGKIAILDTAQDISLFCPRYKSLNQDQKINLWSDVFAAMALYESDFDPLQYSVDVGSQNDRNTWSVGLLQLSVIDQENYSLPMGYTFANLQEPLKNLNLGVAIMAAQIKKYSRVLIGAGSPGLYWATLHPGGRYDASASIETKTKMLSFCKP